MFRWYIHTYIQNRKGQGPRRIFYGPAKSQNVTVTNIPTSFYTRMCYLYVFICFRIGDKSEVGRRKNRCKPPVVIYYYWPCQGGTIIFIFMSCMSYVYFCYLMHDWWYTCTWMCVFVCLWICFAWEMDVSCV